MYKVYGVYGVCGVCGVYGGVWGVFLGRDGSTGSHLVHSTLANCSETFSQPHLVTASAGGRKIVKDMGRF